ncbi:MAG: hypothetical protein ACYC3X_04890 [Pirellulaceae bacterium]
MKSHLVTVLISVLTTLGVVQVMPSRLAQLEVGRLVVRDELIVSDTGQPWEAGFEEQMVARGLYARGGGADRSGLWVRGRLIQSEVDDPFDMRFHSVNRDGSLHRAPGHISWNCWLDGAWRQMAILQGEGLEYSEVPREAWNGGNHPGRLRLQSFRPNHPEPLTDVIVGQGKMSVGGGGYGGGGLPYPSEVLQLWGGTVAANPLATPGAPRVVRDDGTGRKQYSLLAIGPQGQPSKASPVVVADGYATLSWDSTPGADAYLVLRDDQVITAPLRIEGSTKQWTDTVTDR